MNRPNFLCCLQPTASISDSHHSIPVGKGFMLTEGLGPGCATPTDHN